MKKHLNDIGKREMIYYFRLFELYTTNGAIMDDNEIKMMKILRYDDVVYKMSTHYALDYIKRILLKVDVIHDRYFDDNLESICLWEEHFQNELDCMNHFACIFSSTHKHEISVFEIEAYMLNAFIDFLYEEVLDHDES